MLCPSSQVFSPGSTSHPLDLDTNGGTIIYAPPPKPTPSVVSFQVALDAPQFTAPRSDLDRAAAKGSFEYDQRDQFTLTWDSIDAMEAWRARECDLKGIEFIRHKHESSADGVWSQKWVYVCSRGRSGGIKKYIRKYARSRKVQSKKLENGCPCRLVVKTYPNTSVVQGKYFDSHAHETGNSNLRYTHLPKETRREIEFLLRIGVESKKVLEMIQGRVYNENNRENLLQGTARRREFVTHADIRRIHKKIQDEVVRLASQDGQSVVQWVKKLQADGHFVCLKGTGDAPPPHSGLDAAAFVLIIQTKYQRECWIEDGDKRMAFIDATHNTTHYENMSLFTLLVRDRWGHGMPVAWMVSSNGTELTINYFLASIRSSAPGVTPEYFMSDKDHAQLNAIRTQFPRITLYLCWWHVLHAWRQHFDVVHFPQLWDLLQKWLRTEDEAVFWAQWEEIKTLAPSSVVEYLKTYWLKEEDLKMWSNLHRKGRDIFTDSNTNMLLEAWHHLWKSYFNREAGRRVDQLMYTLTEAVIPYFMARHRRQALGFEGPDLELRERLRVEEDAKSIPAAHIKPILSQHNLFSVQSQSDPDIQYQVDIEEFECSCFFFTRIYFCKHLCAVQHAYPGLSTPVPVSALSVHCPDSFLPSPEHSDTESDEDAPIGARKLPPSGGDDPSADGNLDSNLDDIIDGLTSLVIRLRKDRPSKTPEPLLTLGHQIREVAAVLDSYQTDNSLLKTAQRKVAPNQGSGWAQTREVMGVPIKGKKKRMSDSDPYAGGESSGKKAKPDARKPKNDENVMKPSNSNPLKPTPLPSQPPPPIQHLPAPSTYHPPLSNLTNTTPSASSFSTITFSTPTCTIPAPVAFNPPTFNADTFNIRDTVALKRLLRADLNKLCKKYSLKCSGTNEDLIDKLQAIAGGV